MVSRQSLFYWRELLGFPFVQVPFLTSLSSYASWFSSVTQWNSNAGNTCRMRLWAIMPTMLPEHIRFYIDYEAFSRDLFLDVHSSVRSSDFGVHEFTDA
jgi:hypothetical protein